MSELGLIDGLLLFLLPYGYSFVNGLGVLIGAEVAHEVGWENDDGSIETANITKQRKKSVHRALVDFFRVVQGRPQDKYRQLVIVKFSDSFGE